MLDLVFNNFTKTLKYGRGFFENVINEAVWTLGLKQKVEISVNLVGSARIRALNKKYRGKDKPTDVLSFPLQTRTHADRTQTFAKKTLGGIINLGDIFICLPIAENYALKEGVGLSYKLAFLTVHGFLHLLGYDHEKTLSDKKKMFELQSKIIKKLDY